MTRIWSVVLPLALMACAENPAGLQQGVVLEMEPSQAQEEGATVEPAVGGIVVRGVYRMPEPGVVLAHFEEKRGIVTVYIGNDESLDPTRHVQGTVAYRASIPLLPGSHTVRVLYLDTTSRHPSSREVALDVVTVPGRP